MRKKERQTEAVSNYTNLKQVKGRELIKAGVVRKLRKTEPIVTGERERDGGDWIKLYKFKNKKYLPGWAVKETRETERI